MSEQLKVTGTIDKVLELEKGISKAGKEWQKQSFILDSGTEYNNIYCFEMFGEEKVNQLSKHKVGDEVEVSFNVSTNEWKDKYFTSLSAWKVFKATTEAQEPAPVNAEESEDDLPF